MKKKPVLLTCEELNMLELSKEKLSAKQSNRWSEEEDDFLLKRLEELNGDINYSEWLEEYNNTFVTSRTEIALKSRIHKIAKENEIEISSKRGITDDEKSYIYNKIKENPFDMKYDEMAIHLNRSEERTKRLCLDLITSEEQIDLCIQVMNNDIITNIIETYKNNCKNCNCIKYSSMYIWKENNYCEECYEELFREEINKRWNEIHKYSISKNKISCNLCNKNAVINDTIMTRFHYDHIDMFNKNDSICKMVRTGENIDDIYKEIDKCQLLCISCHTLITKIEHKCGFIRFKQQLTRDYSTTSDLIKKEELLNQYSKKYSEFMSKVYEMIKETF